MTARASAERFEALKTDPTLQYTVWLLARLGVAAKSDDFAGQLRELGVDARRASTALGLVAEVGRVVQEHAPPSGALAELAVKAAQRAIAEHIAERARSLFGTTLDDVRAATATFGTKDGLPPSPKIFFGDFAARVIRLLF